MSTTKISLDLIKVASPCTAPWEAMSGDDRTRFCGQCSQYVYNLSEMTQQEAETLVSGNEGKMCVRYYRRFDGTMLTKDCPVGWRAIKQRLALVGGVAATFVVAVFSLLTLGIFAASVRGNGNGGLRLVNPIGAVHDWLFPPQPVMGEAPPLAPAPRQNNKNAVVMGEMCLPQPKGEVPGEVGQPPQDGIAVPVELKKK